MKKVIGLFMLLCLLVFSGTVFADSSLSPPLENQQTKVAANQIDLEIENVVITPINFVEVEISPGDILGTSIYNVKKHIYIFNEIKELQFLFLDTKDKNIYETYYTSLKLKIPAEGKCSHGINRLNNWRCLLLFSIQKVTTNNYAYKEVRIRGVGNTTRK